MYRFVLIFSFLVFGCAHHKPKDAQPSSLVEKLHAKYDGWLKDLKAAEDKNTGWLSLTDCDGTLWAGEALAAGHPLQLRFAEWQPGEIHRRPKSSGDCWLKGDTPEHNHGSASTVSKDMLAGYMLGMVVTKDVDALKRLQSYGTAHNWVMGQPADRVGEVVMTDGAGLLARAVAQLGGEKTDDALIPMACGAPAEDYQWHLLSVSAFTETLVSGQLNDLCFEAVKANAAQHPDDALALAMAGVYSGVFDGAFALLLNDGYKCPGYVRPVPEYCTAHKAFAAKVILDRYK